MMDMHIMGFICSDLLLIEGYVFVLFFSKRTGRRKTPLVSSPC